MYGSQVGQPSFIAGKAAAPHRTHWWGMVLELLYLQGERMWRLGGDS